jgi:hypothetical protein
MSFADKWNLIHQLAFRELRKIILQLGEKSKCNTTQSYCDPGHVLDYRLN